MSRSAGGRCASTVRRRLAILEARVWVTAQCAGDLGAKKRYMACVVGGVMEQNVPPCFWLEAQPGWSLACSDSPRGLLQRVSRILPVLPSV